MRKIASQLRAGSTSGSAFERNDWHTAFYQALQMELRDYRKVLDFNKENQLTKEPLRIDCVVIKKTKDVEIKKNIAAFFREWNIFEYKSPGDYVSVADFYQVYSYACLYISIHNVPITSLTISFVERRYPRELLRHLQNVRGYTVAESAGGIYTVSGDIIPIQIIDSRKLSVDENLWLKSLSNKLNSMEIAQISDEIARQEKDAQIAAYLNVITEANNASIQEAMEMSRRKQKLNFQQVCEKVGLNVEWEAKGEIRGKAEGEAMGEERKAFSIAQNMVNLGLPLETVVSATQLEPEKVKVLYH